jgi:hypothetical protein
MFIKYQVALQTFATELIHRLDEAREDERGQTFVEWLGVMALIVVLVFALKGHMDGIATKVSDVAGKAVDKIGTLVG